MLTELRKQMKLIMWILVFAFLGTIVFSWGMGGFKSKTQVGIIGQIDGDDIEFEDFQRAVQRKVETESRNQEKDLDQDELKKIRENTWDEYVEDYLKSKDAARLRISVSDREIAYIVENFPPNEVREAELFQRDGEFNPEAYRNFLREPSASKFLIGMEQSVRAYLNEQKMNFHVQQATDVTEDEIVDKYNQDYVTAKLRFITVPYDKFDVDSTKITEEMMLRYYRMFPGRFKQYPQSRFVYVKFPVQPSAQDSDEVKQNAEDILDEIRKGADFSTLAEQYSQDPGSAAQGGDLGWFGRGKMVNEFDNAAFNAKHGELLGPITTKLGLHIILVEDIRNSGDDKEIKARHILLKLEPSADTRDEVYNVAYNFSQEAVERGFDLVTNEMFYQVDTTREFSQAGYIAGLGRMRMAAQFCFNNPIGSVSSVYFVPDGCVVFKILDSVEEGVKKFEDVKENIRNRVEKVLKKNLAWDSAAEMRSQIEKPGDIDQVADATGYRVHVTEDSLKPTGSLPDGLKRDQDFIKEAFRLEKGELSEIIEGSNGYYIVYVADKSEIDTDDFAAKHAAIYLELIQKKQDAALRNWIRELRIASDIQDFRYQYYKDF